MARDKAKKTEFAKVLNEGIASVAYKQSKNKGEIEWEIAEGLHFDPSTVQHWCRGNIPSDPEQIKYLARFCVKHGRLDRTWLPSFLTQAGFRADAINDLVQELTIEQPAWHNPMEIRHNIPPRKGECLGREADITRIWEKVNNSRWPIVSIEGFGGVGKTTLAKEIAHRCLATANHSHTAFKGIVWIDATDHPDQESWLPEILDKIGRVLGRDLRQLSTEDKELEVDTLLRSRRTLVIIDNFEAVQDPHLTDWVGNIPEPSKILITSRHDTLRGVWPELLKGLADADALRLIRLHAARLQLPMPLDTDESLWLPLIQITAGNPYAIEMAVGCMSQGKLSLHELINHLYSVSQTVEEIYTCLFAHAWDILAPDATTLLMTTAMFTGSVSKEAFAAVAELKGYYLDHALGQLLEMSLLEAVCEVSTAEKIRYTIHPLTRVFASSKLSDMPARAQELSERYLTWHMKQAARSKDLNNYPDLRPEINNLLGAMEWLAAQARLAELGTFLCAVEGFLYAEGYWEPLLRFTEQVAQFAEATQAIDLYTTLVPIPASIYQERLALDAGERWLKRVEATAAYLRSEELWAEIWLSRARLYEGKINKAYFVIDLEEFTSMVELLKQALAIYRQKARHEKVITSINTLGNLHNVLCEFEQAEKLYQEGLSVLEQFGAQIPTVSYWHGVLMGNIGLIAGRQKRYLEACQILEEVREQLVEQTDLAEVGCALAFYKAQLGKYSEAKRYRLQADELIQKLALGTPVCQEDNEWQKQNLSALCSQM
jgi:hypothetical protein